MRLRLSETSKRFARKFAVLSVAVGLLVMPQWAAAQTAAPAPTIVGSVVTQIAAGAQHTCALTTQADTKPISILCWGNNSHGQLGVGTTVDSLIPVTIDPTKYVDLSPYDNPVVQLAAGDNHSCALLPASGTVVCWGANGSGQLGVGDVTDRSFPTHIPAIYGAAAIAAGSAHTCALLADGTVQCWGDGSHGQLGNGSTGQSTIPVVAKNVSKAIAIAAGGNHTCVLLATGGVQCWGENGNGQLGNGGTADSSTAVGVASLSGSVKTLALGQTHSCALLTDGSIKCWGSGAQGRLGVGTADSSTPVTASVAAGIATSLTAGGAHTCASYADGSVQCWGSNQKGQLGPNATATAGILASKIPGNFVAVTSGSADTCAQNPYGEWRCWGENEQGQLGNATKQVGGILTPMPVYGLAAHPASIAAGDVGNCVLTQAGLADLAAGGQVLLSGAIFCTGSNDTGQLGIGAVTSSSVPTLTPARVIGLDDTVPVAMAMGSLDSCVLLADGTVRCFGYNDFGQLGDGTTGTTPKTPGAKVVGITTATAVTVGSRHGCALLADKTVSCWGWNNAGQLASATLANSSTPVKIPGIANVVAITNGDAHTCVLRGDGTVWCWGNNGSGELGRGTRGGAINEVSVPTQVGGLSNVIAISTKFYHTCALLSNGTVWCWGQGANGQLGNGAMLDSSAPVQVSGLTGVTAITMGGNYGCAVLSDKTARCWGMNIRGALGDGTLVPRSVPVAVQGLSGITSLVVGSEHTCALFASGPMYCWGSDTGGQLGPSTSAYGHSSAYGNAYFTTVPVPILVGQSVSITLPATLLPETFTDLVPTAPATSGMTTTFDGWTGNQCDLQYNASNTALTILHTKSPLLCGVRAEQTGGYNYVLGGGSTAAAAVQLRLVQVGAAATAPRVTLSPNSLAFGSVKAGEVSAARTVTLTNSGDAALNLGKIEVTSTNADLFQQSNACASTLLPNASCVISVTFSPKVTGDFSASISVTDNAVDSPQSAALNGTGIAAGAPKAALTPGTATFGNVTVGSVSVIQTFTLTNGGDAALPITSISLSGTGQGSFKFGTNTCGSSLPSQSSCTMVVTFAPTAAGDATATLSVVDSVGTQSAGLSGTGVAAPAPKAVLTPLDGAFGSVNVGATSASKVFTLANTGNVDLTLTSATIGGANASSFRVAANTCGLTLAQGASCAITVTFQPTVAGSATATLTVVNSAGTQTAALTGTGVAVAAPDFRITSSATELSVSRGASVSATLQLVSADAANPFTGAVALSATGLPTGASVVFSPASLVPGSANATTSTMTITVPVLQAKNDKPSRPFGAVPVIASMAGILLLWPLRRRRHFGLLLLLLVGFSCTLGVTGCAGGSAVAAPGSTSTVTVTGVSGNTAHTATITLKVN